MDWGHHFHFENELGIEIDSLEISIGSTNTMILPSTDSIKSFFGNIDVPKNGYPHEALIKVFYNDNTMTIKADSFNCYNCDGSHGYIMRSTGAEYKFYH